MTQGFFITALILSTLCTMIFAGIIPEEQDFGPIRRPTNPTGARNILGYDHFETTAHAKQQIKYGNNWEQYDNAPEQDFHFNAQGLGFSQNRGGLNSNPNGNNFKSSNFNWQTNKY